MKKRGLSLLLILCLSLGLLPAGLWPQAPRPSKRL